MTTCFKDLSAKCTNLEVSRPGLGLEFQVSSLENFDVASVSKFYLGLGLSLEGYGLDCTTARGKFPKVEILD